MHSQNMPTVPSTRQRAFPLNPCFMHVHEEHVFRMTHREKKDLLDSYRSLYMKLRSGRYGRLIGDMSPSSLYPCLIVSYAHTGL